MKRFFQALAVLLPLGLFAASLQPVRFLLYNGRASQGIILLLVCLAVLAVVEGLLFRYWILPGWGHKLAERLYGGTYNPAQDALACLSERIMNEKAVDEIPALARMVQRQPGRLRGWLVLARLQQELLHDDKAALQTLEQGAGCMSDKEDAALLLYRAASLCEKRLQNPEAAARLYGQAATHYADTVYGRRAAQQAR